MYSLIRANKHINDIIDGIMKTHERILKALANKRRLTILAHLKQTREATVSAIATHIKLSFTSTSRHLNLLARADILDKRQTGLEVYYSLSQDIPPLARIILDFL